MSDNISDEKQPEGRSRDARMAFMAICLIAFVWFCLFIALPALTGKQGVAQKIQQDLEETTPTNGQER